MVQFSDMWRQWDRRHIEEQPKRQALAAFFSVRTARAHFARRRMKSLAAVKINVQLKIISLVRHRHSACALLF
jgi:hypothetical protein